jgi:hypothetical protein
MANNITMAITSPTVRRQMLGAVLIPVIDLIDVGWLLTAVFIMEPLCRDPDATSPFFRSDVPSRQLASTMPLSMDAFGDWSDES